MGEEIPKDHPYFTHQKLNSGPNQWPQTLSDPEEFRRVSMEYYTALHALARDILVVLAKTLDLNEDYFKDFTEGAVATLRYLHYPPQPADSDEKLSRGIGAHTDFGSVTLLMQDEVDGLQVYEKSTQEWLDVVPTKGAYVVNLGNMFMRWSNDKYISNLHRVINKSGKERYSVPFFYSVRHLLLFLLMLADNRHRVIQTIPSQLYPTAQGTERPQSILPLPCRIVSVALTVRLMARLQNSTQTRPCQRLMSLPRRSP